MAELSIGIAFLAVFNEWVCERFFGWWLQEKAMIAVSAAIGVVLCVLFKADALSTMGLTEPLGTPYTGQIMTGLIVGAGSNAWHKFFDPSNK